MRIRIWPNWGLWSMTRFGALLLILAVCGIYSVVILRVRATNFLPAVELSEKLFAATVSQSVLARQKVNSSDIELRKAYAVSLLKQFEVGYVCDKYFAARGVFPQDVSQLRSYGLDEAATMDPWGRPYRIRSLSSNELVIQTTGPSGMDEWKGASSLQYLRDRKYGLAGDNLLVICKIRQTQARGSGY